MRLSFESVGGVRGYPISERKCDAIATRRHVQGKILQVSRGIECRDLREPLGVVACLVVRRPFRFNVQLVVRLVEPLYS